MIILQKFFAEKKKSYRKQNRAAKKKWEEGVGKNITIKKYGFDGLADANEIAKHEIQLEKNGASTMHVGGFMDFIHQKRPQKVEDPKTIEVSADEINRKKARDNRGRHRSFKDDPHEKVSDWKRSVYTPGELKIRREEDMKRIQEDNMSGLKDRLQNEEYMDELKDRSRKRKYSSRAESIRSKKSLSQRIKEDLGIGMSDKAKERFKAKNEKEGQVLLKRLKKESENRGHINNSSLMSIFEGANRKGFKGSKQSILTAHNGYEMAHEMGHAHFYGDKNAGKIGKIAHKLYIGTDPHSKLTIGSGVVAGAASGINKAVKESKGEKETKFEKLSPALTSLAVSAPMLISEAAASKHGIKTLKKAGASRRYINHSKKELAKAWGTYGIVPVISTGLGYGAKAITYGGTEAALELKKDKKSKKKEGK